MLLTGKAHYLQCKIEKVVPVKSKMKTTKTQKKTQQSKRLLKGQRNEQKSTKLHIEKRITRK